MNLKDKIISLAMACLITLIGWQLHETWSLKEQVFKLQQGQMVLSKQVKNTIKSFKKKNKKNQKKKKKKDDKWKNNHIIAFPNFNWSGFSWM